MQTPPQQAMCRYVPCADAAAVGRVIGRDGKTIRLLEKTYQCSIQYNNGTAEFELRGAGQAAEAAVKAMIARSERYVCVLCGAALSSADALEEHVVEEHGWKRGEVIPLGSAWLQVEGRFYYYQKKRSLEGVALGKKPPPLSFPFPEVVEVDQTPRSVPAVFCTTREEALFYRGLLQGILRGEGGPCRPFREYDVICGTSFVQALAGLFVGKDEFCVRYLVPDGPLHVHHVHRPWNLATVGHAVERALSAERPEGSYYAGTTAVIGGKLFLVISEVDMTDEEGRVVEVKSSTWRTGKEFVPKRNALQVLLNGSDYVLGCHLRTLEEEAPGQGQKGGKGRKGGKGGKTGQLPCRVELVESEKVLVDAEDLATNGGRAVFTLNHLLRQIGEYEKDKAFDLTFDVQGTPVLTRHDPKAPAAATTLAKESSRFASCPERDEDYWDYCNEDYFDDWDSWSRRGESDIWSRRAYRRGGDDY
eukprot:Hpha_TRINITY_DN15349_c0_g1::TRINITY_DN15349_c0_g1_i1::g.90258::m.90258